MEGTILRRNKQTEHPLTHLNEEELDKLMSDLDIEYSKQNEQNILMKVKNKNKVKKFPLSKAKKLLLGVVAAVVLIPTGAFAANKLWEVVTHRDGFLTTLHLKSDHESNDFYKLNVGYIPSNLTEVPNNDGMKFWEIGKQAGGISCVLIKPKKDETFKVPYSGNVVKSTINDIQAYTIERKGNNSSFTTITFLLFEKQNRVVEVYFDHAITKEEQQKILSSIRLEKVTAEEASPQVDLTQKREKSKIEAETPLKATSKNIHNLGQSFKTHYKDTELQLNVKSMQESTKLPNYQEKQADFIGQVETLKQKNLIDEQGGLLPYEGTIYSRKDGIKSLDKSLATFNIQPIYKELTIEIKNTSNHKLDDIYLAPQLQVMKEKDKRFTNDYESYINPISHIGDPVYISNHGMDSSYYDIGNLKANEQKTFTIGYIVINPQQDPEFLNFNLDGIGEMDLNSNKLDWVELTNK